MRLWPVLLLLSCSRPNPLFLGDDAGGTLDMTQGTGSSSAATTDAPTTSETTGATAPTTEDASTTGRPLCGPFPTVRAGLDPPLPAQQCLAVTTYRGKVSTAGADPKVSLCLDAQCAQCDLFVAPLDPDLAKYLADGACLRLVHQGAWLPDDPEAPYGCKTTALALYDDDSIYPRYAASSRVTEAPAFLDSDVRMDVSRAGAEACTCEDGDCCLEGQANVLTLDFFNHGAKVATLAPGGFVDVNLKGATYVVNLLRAHVKGQRSVGSDACVLDPETHFVDWEMLRLFGP